MSPIDVEMPRTSYTFCVRWSTRTAAPEAVSLAKKEVPVTRWCGQCRSSFSTSRWSTRAIPPPAEDAAAARFFRVPPSASCCCFTHDRSSSYTPGPAGAESQYEYICAESIAVRSVRVTRSCDAACTFGKLCCCVIVSTR